MKKILLFTLLMLGWIVIISQTTYHYPLKDSFHALETGAPVLIQIPNNSGLTGEFVERNVPASVCGQEGIAPGYFFEDDSGLQFDNPEDFIDKAYSLAFNFQIDEFIYPPAWVRILSFTHEDDVGIYIYLSDPPNHGTLDFWPYGYVGETNFFSPDEFYQMILVRDETGLIKVYVNGEEFAEYNDSQTQAYVPQDPYNYIIFFRDHPSILANEASPGFVSAIHLMNAAWAPAEVENYWSQFCSSLLDIGEPAENQITLYPVPAENYIELITDPNPEGVIRILNLTGQELIKLPLVNEKTSIDISPLIEGLYIIEIQQDGNISYAKFMK